MHDAPEHLLHLRVRGGLLDPEQAGEKGLEERDAGQPGPFPRPGPGPVRRHRQEKRHVHLPLLQVLLQRAGRHQQVRLCQDGNDLELHRALARGEVHRVRPLRRRLPHRRHRDAALVHAALEAQDGARYRYVLLPGLQRVLRQVPQGRHETDAPRKAACSIPRPCSKR